MPKKKEPVPRLPRGYKVGKNQDGYYVWLRTWEEDGKEWSEYGMEYKTEESAILGAIIHNEQLELDKLNSI